MSPSAQVLLVASAVEDWSLRTVILSPSVPDCILCPCLHEILALMGHFRVMLATCCESCGEFSEESQGAVPQRGGHGC